MHFGDYQKRALMTADYPKKGKNAVYPAMGLAGEAGEFCDKIKKLWRNLGTMDAAKYATSTRQEAAKELGDALWYIAAEATELGYTLEEIALLNLAKLKDRKLRGVIKSEGDNR